MHLDLNSVNDINQNNLARAHSLLKQNTVVLNHASWCDHCHDFMPQYERYMRTASSSGVNTLRIENDALNKIKQIDPAMYKMITPSDGRIFFPMVIIIAARKPQPEFYNGPRTAKGLREQVDKIVKPSPKTPFPKTPSTKTPSTKTPSPPKTPSPKTPSPKKKTPSKKK